jgi:hypothetical protein
LRTSLSISFCVRVVEGDYEAGTGEVEIIKTIIIQCDSN